MFSNKKKIIFFFILLNKIKEKIYIICLLALIFNLIYSRQRKALIGLSVAVGLLLVAVVVLASILGLQNSQKNESKVCTTKACIAAGKIL